MGWEPLSVWASRHGLSDRQARRLAEEGRLPSVRRVQVGPKRHRWEVPEGTPKPVDRRTVLGRRPAGPMERWFLEAHGLEVRPIRGRRVAICRVRDGETLEPNCPASWAEVNRWLAGYWHGYQAGYKDATNGRERVSARPPQAGEKEEEECRTDD